MTDAVSGVVVTCLSTLLSDDAWQDFGFVKRPRHGSFFQNFRPTWKIDLENKVIQEMLSTLTAAHVLADRITSEDIPRIIAAYTARADLVASLGYSSRDESAQHLAERIACYRKTPLADWHIVIAKRIAPNSIPDKKLSARVLIGCVRFSIHISHMIPILRENVQP